MSVSFCRAIKFLMRRPGSDLQPQQNLFNRARYIQEQTVPRSDWRRLPIRVVRTDLHRERSHLE